MTSESSSHKLYQAARESKELPLPQTLAQHHSEKLIELIKNEIIHTNGAISFKRYMELSLYAPGLGYYAAGSIKLGKEGDFITAPEISPLFSCAIANALIPVLTRVKIVLEVGAGSGRMAADILNFLAAKDALPDEYWILELSADLRERQRETIKNTIPDFIDKVKWLDTLPQQFSGVVVANELLDAMPVQLFQKTENDFNEINVGWDGQKFVFLLCPSSDARLQHRLHEIESVAGAAFTPGYLSEVNFAAEDWIQSIAERLQQGLILLIDYGFPQHEYYHPQRDQGTLMCHYRHRSHTDPFVYPGLQDITAHVDFTAMADAALAADLNVVGYTNQVSFLMGAGLIDLAAAVDQSDIKNQMNVASEIKKLTLPHEMGELFKVIGFSKNCDVTLPAFLFRDLREYL
jgi:SAM-dependent MidA family methyltransferase